MILQTTDTPEARHLCAKTMAIRLDLSDRIETDLLTLHGLRHSGVSFPVAESICEAYKAVCGVNPDGTLSMPNELPVKAEELPDWILEGLFDDAVCPTCGKAQKSPDTAPDEPKERDPNRPLSGAQKKLMELIDSLDAGVYEHRVLCTMMVDRGLSRNQAVYAINTLPESCKEMLTKHDKKGEEGRVLMVVKPLECS